MNLETMLSGGVTLVSIVGVLAFFIAIVTQLTKEFVPKSVPTKLYVLILSVAVTVTAILCYLSYKSVEIKLYIILGSIALGFIVAFIATYGWSEFKELKDRFMRK